MLAVVKERGSERRRVHKSPKECIVDRTEKTTSSENIFFEQDVMTRCLV